MVTVALIGPDGTGKSTVFRRLENEFPLPAKYVYMGISLESSNLMLPTTRLILSCIRRFGANSDWTGSLDSGTKMHSWGVVKGMVAGLRSILLQMNLIAEELFHQIIAQYYQHRGFIVLFDRHFIADYYTFSLANIGARYIFEQPNRFLLERLYPKPDLVICLDAPPDVMFARKGEKTLEKLELMRQGYLGLHSQFRHFITVDANRSEEEVVAEVADIIQWFQETKSTNQLSTSISPECRKPFVGSCQSKNTVA